MNNTNPMKLKVKRLHPEAIIPRYATDGAACFDLHALTGESGIRIPPGCSEIIDTGLAVEIPPGWCLKLYGRSGHGARGVTLGNAVGIIDSDYRGPLRVILRNHCSYNKEQICNGDRIAQAMLERVERVEFVEVEELSETARGAGGFGSTGSGLPPAVESEGGEAD